MSASGKSISSSQEPAGGVRLGMIIGAAMCLALCFVALDRVAQKAERAAMDAEESVVLRVVSAEVAGAFDDLFRFADGFSEIAVSEIGGGASLPSPASAGPVAVMRGDVVVGEHAGMNAVDTAAAQGLAARLSTAPIGAEAALPALSGAGLLFGRRIDAGSVVVQLRPSPLGALGEAGARFALSAAADGAGLGDRGTALGRGGLHLVRADDPSGFAGFGYAAAATMTALFLGLAALGAAAYRAGRSELRSAAPDEQTLRQTLVAERTSDFALFLDTEGAILWANRAMLDATGFSLEELTGARPGDRLAGPETDQDEALGLREAIAHQRSHQARLRLYRKSGEAFLGSANLTPVRADDGGVDGFTVIIRDVTETAEMERRLNEAVDAIVSPFSIVDADERFVVSNEAHRELLASVGVEVRPGLSYVDAIEEVARKGRADMQDMSPDEWAAARISAWRATSKQEFIVSTADGRDLLQRDVRTPSGEMVSLMTDVTELTRARAAAEAALEEKDRVAATITHELRTPLIGVISMASLVMESELTEDQRASIRLIRDSGEELLEVINDILDLSKLEAGKLSLRSEAFDIVETVEDVMALLAPSAAAKNLDWTFRFDPEAPRGFRGDAGRIRQILTNLLGNAVKFTDLGGVLVRLEATAGAGAHGANEARMRILVEDTGPGVAEDDIARIFAPYEQAGVGTAGSDRGGSGLGLSICNELARMMGGELFARSELGLGSTFGFEAPFALAPTVLERPLEGMRISLSASEPEYGGLEDQARALGATIAADGEPFDLSIVAAPEAEAVELSDLCDGSAPTICIASSGASSGMPSGAATGAPSGFSGDEFGSPISVLRRPVLMRDLARAAERLGSSLEAAGDAAAGRCRDVGPLIVLVEDNDTSALIVEAMLAGAPYSLQRFSTAADALNGVRSLRPDLVLMDVNLPDASGPEAVERLRRAERDEGFGPTTVVGFTASVAEADREACLAAGMRDVLRKPISRPALLEALHRFAPVEGAADGLNARTSRKVAS